MFSSQLKYVLFGLSVGALLSCAAQTPPALIISVPPSISPAKLPAAARTLAMFEPGAKCYNRSELGETFVVDSHNHFRPFGGAALPIDEINQYLLGTGVLFANVYGIGQSLPVSSDCEYYLDCIGTPALPSMKNDFANAQNYLDADPTGTVLTLSMTFPDLADPSHVVEQIQILDTEYPDMFKWMGEVNLVKQALFGNAHSAAPMTAIAKWAPFMEILRDRNIPIAIHSDLGSDANPTKYLSLMHEVLRQYPDNKIVWVHMGLSKELKHMDVDQHLAIMSGALEKNPNLLLDITWRVLNDNYFQDPAKRAKYVAFFEQYSTRILPGTDFVASHKKNFDIYRDEVLANSDILGNLNNTAFRNIALGENYFRLLGMKYVAPQICAAEQG